MTLPIGHTILPKLNGDLCSVYSSMNLCEVWLMNSLFIYLFLTPNKNIDYIVQEQGTSIS